MRINNQEKRGNFCGIRTESPRTQRTQSNFYLRGPDKEKKVGRIKNSLKIWDSFRTGCSLN